MITATIGKIFLEAYNEKFGTNYDAKTFFVEVYYPLFFDSNKYLQWVTNSPFVQMEKGQKVETLTPAERKDKLQKFITKVEQCKTPDASIAPGFPASEAKEFATTSGQVTNIQLPNKLDDIYFAWIGSSLGIGLEGGLSILFSEKQILLDLFDGWQLYRNSLNENNLLKGNKINTWNGQWLSHRYDNYSYNSEQPMADFAPFVATKDGMNVKTQSWLRVIVGIAKHFDNPKMIGYVYNFDKMNTTIGFIPFCLEHIRRPFQLYRQLFGETECNRAEKLWNTEKGLRVCCYQGAIGIAAMKPQKLQSYIMTDKAPKVKDNDEEQTIQFHTYQIWLLAMLNNQELWDKSQEFAKVLHNYTSQGKNGKTTNSRQIDTVLAATNKKSFIEALTTIASESNEVNSIVEMAQIVNLMPTDNVPYLLTLIRFHYATLQSK